MTSSYGRYPQVLYMEHCVKNATVESVMGYIKALWKHQRQQTDSMPNTSDLVDFWKVIDALNDGTLKCDSHDVQITFDHLDNHTYAKYVFAFNYHGSDITIEYEYDIFPSKETICFHIDTLSVPIVRKELSSSSRIWNMLAHLVILLMEKTDYGDSNKISKTMSTASSPVRRRYVSTSRTSG